MKLYVTVNHEIICQPYNVLNDAHKLFLANQKRVFLMWQTYQLMAISVTSDGVENGDVSKIIMYTFKRMSLLNLYKIGIKITHH